MKKIVKYIVIGFFYILILPFGFMAKGSYLLLKTEAIFTFFAQAFSLVPGIPGNYIRLVYYMQTLKKCHLDCTFIFGSLVSRITAELHHGVGIGAYAIVGNYEIGEQSVIGNKVSLLSGGRQHNFENLDAPILDGTNNFEKMKIGKRVFIGEMSVVMANIGDQTIVGAGSVVTRELPSRVIAVGHPARVIKERK
jgi:acetyltransferase-like isoleucine patch superfamily enzyme